MATSSISTRASRMAIGLMTVLMLCAFNQAWATDIRITMAASSQEVNVGDELVYTITVDNSSTFGGGPFDAPNTVVTDNLPSQLQFVSASAGQGSCSVNGQSVQCNLGQVNTNAQVPVSIVVRALTAGTVTNSASVTTGIFDPNPGNNTASVTVTIRERAANLTLEKSAPQEVNQGDEFDFIAVVTNEGPDDSEDTQFEDVMPSAFTPMSATVGSGTCSVGGQTVTCNLGTIGAGQSRTITMRVKAALSGSYANKAVAVNALGSSAQGSATVEINDNAADVYVNKTSSAGHVRVGDEFTYTVTVGNAGPQTANGVTFEDYLPLGRVGVQGTQVSAVDVISVAPEGLCSVSEEVDGPTTRAKITCEIGSLASGEEIEITYLVHVLSRDNLTNIATATSTTPDDPDDSNNFQIYDVTVQGAPGSAANNPGGGEVGDPVHLWRGELIFSEPADLASGGPLPLEFRRFYASQLVQDARLIGTLGPNWSHTFDWRLLLPTAEDAEVVSSEGQVIAFERSGPAWDQATGMHYPYQLVEANNGYWFGDPVTHLMYRFDAGGQLIRIEDGNGNHHDLTYSSGRLSAVADGLGREIVFTYDSNDKLRSVTDGNRTVTFEYGGGVLVGAVDPLGGRVTYAYDEEHSLPGLLISRTDPLGHVTSAQTYDAFGRVATQTDADGHVYSFTYGGGMVVAEGPGGRREEYGFDQRDFLTSSSNGAGSAVLIDHLDDGRRISVTDRTGNTLAFAYDAASRLPSAVTRAGSGTTEMEYVSRTLNGLTFHHVSDIRYPDGSTDAFTYDARGNLTGWTNRRGHTASITYDEQGNPVSQTNFDGNTFGRVFNADGTLASLSSPTGNTVTYQYDDLKRRVGATLPDGKTVLRSYDARDHITSETDPAGRTVTYEYDANGNIVSTTDALGGTVRFSYDAFSRPLSLTDQTGATWSATYDPFGNFATFTEPTGATTTYTYDAQGRLTGAADPEGNVWSTALDANNRPLSLTDPLGNQTAFEYDADRRLAEIRFGTGAARSFAYDANGRVSSVQHATGRSTQFSRAADGTVTGIARPGAPAISLEVSPLGQAAEILFGDGTWERSYDPLGRLASLTDPVGNTRSFTYDERGHLLSTSIPGTSSLEFMHDALGNPTSITPGAGSSITFDYDAAGRITGSLDLTLRYDGVGNIIESNGINLSRDGAGRISALNYDDGRTVRYEYDGRGLLTQVEDWVGGETTFHYDSAGRLMRIERPNGVDTRYRYDANRALIAIHEEADSPLTSMYFTRDAAGELLQADRFRPQDASWPAFGEAAFDYNAARQRNDFTYDAAGRTLSDAVRSYSWDDFSRLSTFSVNGTEIQFERDAFGRIVRRTEGEVTLGYRWNYGFDLPAIACITSSTGDEMHFVHTPDGMLLHGIDAMNNSRFFYHFDERGNTSLVTDDEGMIWGTYGYEPYGQLNFQSAGIDNPFTYMGRWSVLSEDSEGLYHTHGRTYDAGNRIFLSPDYSAPLLSLPAPYDFDPYAYAGSDPVNHLDPTGTNVLPATAEPPSTGFDVLDALSFTSFLGETILTGFDTRINPAGARPIGGLARSFFDTSKLFAQAGNTLNSPGLRAGAVDQARNGVKATKAASAFGHLGTGLFAFGGILEIGEFWDQREEALTETERNKKAALDAFTAQVDAFLETYKDKHLDATEIRRRFKEFQDQYEENWDAAVDIGVSDLWLEFWRSTGRFLGGALPLPLHKAISNMQSD